MEIKKVLWFSGSNIPGVMGVVMGEDTLTKKKKAYMGMGTGLDDKIDQKVIAAHGTPVNVAVFQEIVDYLKE